MKLLDTCFLIDLQRELQAGKDGPASAWLADHRDERFSLSVISITEFLEGIADPDAGEGLLRPFRWLPVNARVGREAARIRRRLRLKGELIGDFDILIAATALAVEIPLVTRNTTDFQRIPGLVVEGY